MKIWDLCKINEISFGKGSEPAGYPRGFKGLSKFSCPSDFPSSLLQPSPPWWLLCVPLVLLLLNLLLLPFHSPCIKSGEFKFRELCSHVNLGLDFISYLPCCPWCCQFSPQLTEGGLRWVEMEFWLLQNGAALNLESEIQPEASKPLKPAEELLKWGAGREHWFELQGLVPSLRKAPNSLQTISGIQQHDIICALKNIWS